MPPKKAAASSQIFIVKISDTIDSAFASLDAANERLEEIKGEDDGDAEIITQALQGGSITLDEKKAPPKKAAPKAKASKAAKSDDGEAPKANTAAKKTKSVEEQRAEKAKKPAKAGDADVPANIKALLAGKGSVLDGKNVVVTGVPPTMTRKNAETLVELYGGKLQKSLNKKTDYVFVGNDAGPKKLEQIETLGVETLDEDDFVALLESGGAGTKHGASDEDDEDEEEEEEEEEVKPAAKGKKQRR